MRCTETWLKADDSTKLFIRHYQQKNTDDSRTLLIVHGMSEHGGRYEHVARRFFERGWNVVVPDMRGHGVSGGRATHVRSFRQYHADLLTIRKHVGCEPAKMAILGHSMGALIVARHAQLMSEQIGALVLISPLLGIKVPIPRRTIALGRLLSVVMPTARFKSRVDPIHITRNEEVLVKRANDPLIHDSVTAGWFFAMKAALASVWNEAASIQNPLLIMQAGKDEIVDPIAPEQWLQHVGSRDKTFHNLTEHLHELLNEPDWQETLEQIDLWLNRQIAPQGDRGIRRRLGGCV